MSTDSIYQYIRQHLTVDGTLPEDFSLPKETKTGQLTFADGAMDGITVFHTSQSEIDPAPLCSIIELIMDDQEESAILKLQEIFPAGGLSTMLSYIDGLQSWIYENRDSLSANKLYKFASQLLTTSNHPETIKFALSILELLNTQDDEALQEIIMILAASDEFTLFCLFVISDWPDKNKYIFTMAQNVQGWGRIHAVERLEPETPLIREWLLTEGWKNNIISAYSAMTCIENGNQLEKLQQNQPRSYADGLLQAAMEGGPVASLFAYEEGEPIILAYLNQKAPLTIQQLETAKTIIDGLASSNWPAKDAIQQECQTRLNSKEAQQLLIEAISNGKNFSLAMDLGIDCSKEIMQQIQQDFDSSYHLISLLLPKKLYVNELITLFCEKLPLKTMSTGPANELGISPEFTHYHQLTYILQHLQPYPNQGEPLLCCALQAPVVNCRNMALSTLEAWIKEGQTPSPAVQNVLHQLVLQEMDDKILDRLKQLIAQL